MTHHIGIYVDNGPFIHASKSMRVTTSRLDENYWRRSYETSVCVI
ncbi:NlpC/P60 family protein [Hafnia paralvei]|nr:NlpC/P60 family protein [Hafnia paralvei]MCQ4169178.1 NlpC/P60 family protein [Hafnia paralvei]MDX6841735.1 NlpC/P60 family protein [Hafnia paralvei]